MSFGTETNSNVAEINGSIYNLYGKTFDKEERLKKIEKVTLEDVNNFAKRILNEKEFAVVAVGKDLSLEDLKEY